MIPEFNNPGKVMCLDFPPALTGAGIRSEERDLQCFAPQIPLFKSSPLPRGRGRGWGSSCLFLPYNTSNAPCRPSALLGPIQAW